MRVTDDQELTGYRFVALNRAMTRAARLQEMLAKQPPPPLDKAVAIAAGEYAPDILAWAQWTMQQQAAQMQQQAQQTGQQPPEMGEQRVVSLIMQHPAMQEQVTANQVTKMLVDIVLDEAPDTAIMAQEEFSTLTEMAPAIAQARPDMMPTFLKMLVRSSALPNKRDLLRELDKGPDPQQQQMQQQQQAMQQQMVQLQLAMQQATIAVGQTKAALQQAQAEKTAAETQQIAVETQIAPAKAEAEIASQQAAAISHAADAGAKTGGAMPQGMM